MATPHRASADSLDLAIGEIKNAARIGTFSYWFAYQLLTLRRPVRSFHHGPTVVRL